MTFKEAFQLAVTTLQASAVLTGYGVTVQEGVHALSDIGELSQQFKTHFADHRFTVIVEHPGSSVQAVGAPTGHLVTTFSLVLVENPRHRAGSVHVLDVIQAIAEALYLQPATLGSQGVRFLPAPDFYRYVGDHQGQLYQRFTYTITTALLARGVTRPTPIAVG